MLAQKVVLIVEDNPINRATLKMMLSQEYRILEAENGREALAILEKHKDEISVILLDIIMPVMDGYTFLSIAKANSEFASIPIIVTTQNDSETDEVTALSHGATDFVPKPYKPQILRHRVASIINLRETAAMINQFQFDRLTGLYSREFFYKSVQDALRQSPQEDYDIICSNIENFKLFNEVFGPAAGDQLLRDIAGLFQSLSGRDCIFGRLNADQFACLVKARGHYGDEIFMDVMDKIALLPNAKNVTMKWGVFSIRDRSVPIEQMCDRALWAAHSIRGQYGKFFVLYDDKMRNELLRQQRLIDSMVSGLEEEQFQVFLQPKYHLADAKIAGAEALVRWAHPEIGFLSPAEFIPLFEKNNFITRLDQYVWDKTCAMMREWDDLGLPAIPVSVNVSRADIFHMDIADILMEIVQRHGLRPERLHLEITESSYTDNPGQIIETLRQLRSLGFIIEMDDFGSGYSSLNMLNQMPIDILKLDMKFIQGWTRKSKNRGVMQFIMNLARWMNLSVVAEGVETREQVDWLLEVGCDYVQGYYFAKPMPAQRFETLLKGDGAATESENSRPGEMGAKGVLLIADENPAYREAALRACEELFQVQEAGNAEEAIQRIHSSKGAISAILVSATLPQGEALSRLKADMGTRAAWNAPVIVSGAHDPRQEEAALEAGALDYICKPHTAASLQNRLLRAIKLASYQAKELHLKEAAYRDSMTGILNRNGWRAALEGLRREDAPLACLLFDLDNLRRINDSLGYEEGDRLIVAFSKILKETAREGDIVARFGGDAFFVIMRQMASEEEALKMGGEICRKLSEVSFAQGARVTASAGISLLKAGEPVSEIVKRVDTALYKAKQGHSCGEARRKSPV